MFDLKKMNEALKDASSGSDTIVNTNTSTEIASDKPKRTRKPKAQSTAIGTDVSNSSTPYNETYGDTTAALENTIIQLDSISAAIYEDIDAVRRAKTMKGKYVYLPTLYSALSTAVSNKLRAISEINSCKTNSHNLDLKRLKEVKSSEIVVSDDKYVADLYGTYINPPVKTNGPLPLMQNTSSNLIGSDSMMNGMPVGQNNVDNGFSEYMNNLSPEQNRMLQEKNPNIQTVVICTSSDERWFDVIDITTGMPVPNYPRPNPSFLDECHFDFANGIATNTNIGQSWRIYTVPDTALNKF